MRLFVAINLPAQLRQQLFEATSPIRDGQFPFRWVMPDSMHLTLKFLGEVDGERAADVRRVLHSTVADRQPFGLRLSRVGAFPQLRRPRVLWVGVRATDVLFELQRAVEQDLVPLGFAAEKRPFSPHLTLGRVRAGARSVAFSGLEAVAESVEIDGDAIEVREIHLMRSRLGPGGARYENIDRFPLSGAGDGE